MILGSERARTRTRTDSHTRTESGQSLPEPTFARPLLLPRSPRSRPDPNPKPTSNVTKPAQTRIQTRLSKPRHETQTPPEQPIVLPPPSLSQHSHSQSGEDRDEEPTPNVYINGLPPHFPEADLWALAAPFGEVRSVRGFTRWVGGRASGYGFVLFDSVGSAMRCITKLRERRDLHPSFSKVGLSFYRRSSLPRRVADRWSMCRCIRVSPVVLVVLVALDLEKESLTSRRGWRDSVIKIRRICISKGKFPPLPLPLLFALVC